LTLINWCYSGATTTPSAISSVQVKNDQCKSAKYLDPLIKFNKAPLFLVKAHAVFNMSN